MCWRRVNPENQAKSQQWALKDDKASLFLARNPLGNRFECGFDFPRRATPLKVRPPIFIVRQAPSQADRVITAKLKEALALIDVRVLDHFIVGETVFSFAEHGLL